MDSIKNWINGSTSSESEKLQNLKRKARLLRARAADVSAEVEQEEFRSGKKRKQEVDNWLKEVNQVESQLNRLEQVLTDIDTTPDFHCKSQAGTLTVEVELLLQQGMFHRGLTLRDHEHSSMALVTTDMKINGHKLKDCKKKIMECLNEDSGISRIGVFGPGGVGKTSLLKEIHNELLEQFKNSSGCIYWVSASHGATVSMLQDKIADALDLCYLSQEKNEMKKAASLSYKMKQIKNLVLILDDVWEHFSLEDVGITVGENDNNKLILITRSLDVCRRMNCQETVKVELLSEAEAWKLFSIGLGRQISAEAEVLGKLVAAECGGLPLGIIVMAGSMRGVDDIEEWRNTLDELRNSTEGLTDIETDVFPVLKLSYDRLKDRKLQQCFLLCALYPKYDVIKRDELITLFRLEGLLDGIDSWQKQLDKGHSMLNTLENVCLLEKVNSSMCISVKMHNLIRDMAIRITKLMPRFMVASGAELKRIPSGNKWPFDVDKVSLMHNSLSEILPGTTVPMCPSLSTLLLQRNPFTKLPDNFFVHMTGLKVLNLSKTGIKRLPVSVSELKSLRALLLESCSRLQFVPSLVKLTKLRELSLSFCWSLKDVPVGIEQLTNLRFLDLEGSKYLCQLFGRSFPSFSRIQYLKLDPNVQCISGDNIQKLWRLERLEGCRMSDISSFNKYVKTRHFHQLNYYEFVVGAGEYKRIENSQNLNTSEDYSVVLASRSLRSGSVNELFVLPRNVQTLQVHNCDFLEETLVVALPSLCNLTALRNILIRRCRQIEFIWSPLSCTEAAPLHSLTELTLSDLQNFRGLVNDGVALPQGAFHNLKKVVIKFCPEVKSVFTLRLLKTGFQSLQELEVEGNDELETIVAKNDCDDGDSDLTGLPNLKTLKLRRLPKLISIWHRGLLGNGSVEEFVVEYCAEVKVLVMLTFAQHYLRNLREIKVTCCGNLEEIVASPVCKNQNCRVSVNELQLPNFKTLLLDDLPNLRSLFTEDRIPVCRSIEGITVRDCPKMRKLPISIPISSNGEALVPLCLQEIKAGREWWDSLVWDNIGLKPILQPFTMLVAGKSSFKIQKGPSSSGGDLRLKDVTDFTGTNDVDESSCVLDGLHQNSK